MAKRMKPSAYLANVTSIPMECSDVENDELYDSEGELLENQSDPHGSNDNSIIIESSDTKTFRINVQEDVCDCLPVLKTKVKVKYKISKLKLLQTELFGKKIEGGGVAGRLPVQCIFKNILGPTAHAKRNIMKGKLSSAFLLLIDHHILEYVRTCTELQAFRVLGKKWIRKEKMRLEIHQPH
ncbi:hypothetical protein ANTRET_LOCUS6980, partial [Anthophora retusa]